MALHMGLDVGSTTVKVAILDDNFETLYYEYVRHKSDVKNTVKEVISRAYPKFKNEKLTINVTGSGGMFVEKYLGINFVQEVVAETKAIRTYIPDSDVVIELGGEDSKITYLSSSVEQRMNSVCAGGTGAFIDQMASLLDTDAKGLNNISKKFKKLYPIASRCGVFAKTDIQALMNQGVSKEDIAISVFQSVVNQTISNLACGRAIRGKIVFLGGPLHFLTSLRDRFIETLSQEGNTFETPVDGEIYVAKGAAILSCENDEKPISFLSLMQRLKDDKQVDISSTDFLDPLFSSEEEYEIFKKSHSTNKVKYSNLEEYEGEIFLGIDAGSTTSKMVLISQKGEILYSDYRMNTGSPLDVVIEMIKEAYLKINDNAKIVSSGICGYGEEFIKKALKIDTGEVETIAHYTAAKFFNPDVDFILDIGGQDMKAMHIRDGVIDSIQLNESCSSGCGSFLSTFSTSVGMKVDDFLNTALFAKKPADLGSRCTVFMNSNVKQAQKEGLGIEDIASGLCYSVIKNSLQKVIKVRDPKDLGKNIVVQGGTFYSDAILRAFEKITGREVMRPEISGLMGAMGMALIAKKRSTGNSSILDYDDLESFTYRQVSTRCGKCTNNCALSVNIFPDGSKYISGNRCERGAGIIKKQTGLNMYKFKEELLFNRLSLGDNATMGKVGIARVLNMYEDYPFWHTFFTKLGFDVVLSEKTSRKTYEDGIESIPDETACYPAKLVHGHINQLIDKNLDMIFYPAVFYEKKQFDNAKNSMNCPVVSGYPDVIKNNQEKISDTKFLNPYLSFESEKQLSKRLVEIFKDYEHCGKKLKVNEIKNAVSFGWDELEKYHREIKYKAKEIIDYVNENKKRAVVLAGRPYHVDPEINHGIADLLESMDLAVLTEDAVSYNFDDLDYNVRVLDQWAYHARLYRAANFVCENDNFELVQLNSFGCGLDAVTTDQVEEILKSKGKIYTMLKIDEVSNLGAVKIRIRSLIEALNEKEIENLKINPDPEILNYKTPEFTKQMKNDGYTILAPQMAPEHFSIIQSALKSEGYNFEFLKTIDNKVIDQGLKYVNNDSCYPSITVVGQFMEAMNSGRYDPNRTALLMTQTGGACRASNYVGYIRKALKDAGFKNVPVIALSAQGIETNSGFKISISMIKKLLYSILLGDVVMQLSNATRPYEVIKGSTNVLKEKWISNFRNQIKNINYNSYKKMILKIVNDFDNLEVKSKNIVKVGIVGEILVKFLPQANNNLQKILEDEGCEVVVPPLMDFFLYCLKNAKLNEKYYKKSKIVANSSNFAIKFVEKLRKPIRDALKNSKRFKIPMYIDDILTLSEKVTSSGNHAGEGWLLSGEMVELIEEDVSNIVCIQPFGCLPNHITGKGVMKKIREEYPKANIVAIDYDPSASKVNQINRIKLMISQAKENLKKDKDLKKYDVQKKYILR
ncbi:MAG: acyl-CoA dehydratase activase-related protein [Peptoniphilaceae bacterium]|nr:2-hydroxyacyl-CoA dehydratase [Peptoniphilaceae bacterium]MDD7383888.1 acyl-CoA dehydratase activase-related protein [Peptoniphilaceae bacterium]MDY3738029.1 acyl-CoA dehydratase activase-related protein [Peptoniphilaceae bacterium]